MPGALLALLVASGALPAVHEDANHAIVYSAPLPNPRQSASPKYVKLWSTQSTQVGQKTLTGLFWSHIPKTSTTFGRTVYSYACGPDADEFDLVGTEHPPNLTLASCGHRIARDQMALLKYAQITGSQTWLHSPVPQNEYRSAIRPGANVVTLLRDPAERLSSMYKMISGCAMDDSCAQCCAALAPPEPDLGTTWGWTPETRSAALMQLQYRPAPGIVIKETERRAHFKAFLESRHALYGCQTKMLLGYGCQESRELTGAEIKRAQDLVLGLGEGIGFIGLTERYAESVCLFHAIHGGDVYDFEVRNGDTPTMPSSEGPDEVRRRLLEAEWFRLGPADPDETIYRMATFRFDQLLQLHAKETAKCVAAVMESGGTTFSS